MDIRKRLIGLSCEKDPDSVIVRCNDIFLEYAGVVNDDKVLGCTDFDLCWQDRAELYLQHELDALAGKHYSTLIPLTVDNGEQVLFMHTKSQKKNEFGIVTGITCHSVEIFNPDVNHLFSYLLTRSPHEKNVFFLDKNQQEYNLTRREKEILFFISKGKTAKAIAKALGLSPKTIACHIEHIKKKMECKSKSEIIDKAYELGFSQLLPSLSTDKILGIMGSE